MAEKEARIREREKVERAEEAAAFSSSSALEQNRDTERPRVFQHKPNPSDK